MNNLRNVLVLDIETISGYPDFQSIPHILQKHWIKKCNSFKIENPNPEVLYYEKAAIYAEFGKVIVIAVGIYDLSGTETGLRVKYFSGHHEYNLLKGFSTFLTEKFDKEKLALCAHNGREFDFPYLSRRLLVNGLTIPYVLNLSGKKPWEINHLDTMELWKFGDWKSFTSLSLLTEIFGIPTSKDDIDGSQVNHVYYKENGLERITDYCCKDVIATAQLYLKMNNLSLIDPSRITIIN